MKRWWLVIAVLMALVGCQPKTTSYSTKEGDPVIRVMIANDMHLLSPSLHDGSASAQQQYNARDGKLVEYSYQIMEAFVAEALQQQPDFVILAGDLTFNGEKQSHQDLADLLRPLKDAGIQVLVIPGNHDIHNSFAFSFQNDETYYTETVEPEDFATIYADQGYQNCGHSYDEASLSYLVKASEKTWFLMLDTNRYELNSGFGVDGSGKFRDGTVTWMEEIFKEAREQGATIITVTHENLLKNPYLHTEDGRIKNAKKLKNLMLDGTAYLNLSGHLHTQEIVTEEYEGAMLYEIVTEALSVGNQSYGWLTIEPDAIRYEARQLDVEAWAKQQGMTDENLLHFTAYGWQHFVDVSYTLFLRTYEQTELPQTAKEEIASLMAEVNPYRFAGRLEELREWVLTDQRYQTYLRYQDQLPVSYTLEMLLQAREQSQREIVISRHR